MHRESHVGLCIIYELFLNNLLKGIDVYTFEVVTRIRLTGVPEWKMTTFVSLCGPVSKKTGILQSYMDRERI